MITEWFVWFVLLILLCAGWNMLLMTLHGTPPANLWDAMDYVVAGIIFASIMISIDFS